MFEGATITVNRAEDASSFLFPFSQKDGGKGKRKEKTKQKKKDDKLLVLINFPDVSTAVPKKTVI